MLKCDIHSYSNDHLEFVKRYQVTSRATSRNLQVQHEFGPPFFRYYKVGLVGRWYCSGFTLTGLSFFQFLNTEYGSSSMGVALDWA
ncbi:unnamed protein product [Cylindrotheca closterium]|uniref:Uncharacterized protein n=1 Tax=Cylindrotheca closterium TaxID=2856 RepID=A0AAD2FNK9_9STRA|nr:unnamed protein product [Cylindrotheca closterium]